MVRPGWVVASRQATFIRAVEELADDQMVRSDGRRNLLAIAWIYARRTGWQPETAMVSSPSRALVMQLTGLSDATVKRWTCWMVRHGVMAQLEVGRLAQFRPMAVQTEGGRVSVYVICARPTAAPMLVDDVPPADAETESRRGGCATRLRMRGDSATRRSYEPADVGQSVPRQHDPHMPRTARTVDVSRVEDETGGMQVDGSDAAPDEVPLSTWDTFPVSRAPRPIILLDQPVDVGAQGFVDSESKFALMSGAVETTVALPKGVLDLVTGDRVSHELEPLQILGIEAVTAAFRTDRGPCALPAYRIELTGAAQPCTVLDPVAEIWWPPRDQWGVVHPGYAEIEPDGRTVHLRADGGEFTEFLRAEFVEHPTVVVAKAITSHRPITPGTALRLIVVSKPVTGVLTAPLGNRVLVDERGNPCVVVPAQHGATAS